MGIICVNIHQVLDLLPFILCFLHYYEYLYGLAILEEDAVGADLDDCIESNMGHF